MQSSLTNKTLFLADKVISSLPMCGNLLKSRRVPPKVIGLQQGTQRAAFPLSFGHSNDYITTRAALIGFIFLFFLY